MTGFRLNMGHPSILIFMRSRIFERTVAVAGVSALLFIVALMALGCVAEFDEPEDMDTPEEKLANKNCNEKELDELEWARSYLVKYRHYMAEGASRRIVRRRARNRIGNHHFNCNPGDCENTVMGSHYYGILNPTRSRICYESMKNWGMDICDLVDVVAHEFGHSINTGTCDDHNNACGQTFDDETYNFGYRMRDHCREHLSAPWDLGSLCNDNVGGTCVANAGAGLAGRYCAGKDESGCNSRYQCSWVAGPGCDLPPVP
jgi:hypothetical protein